MKTQYNLFTPAWETAKQIREKQISSRAVVESYIDQINKYNKTYNAIVYLNDSEALKQADLCDTELKQGKIRGPLHGVPISIKDTYQTAGITTTAGYTPLKDYVPTDDAVLVKLLKDAGAIIIGKSNTCTLAMDMQTDNPIFGKTNNPWDTSLTPAGSSGGCATAVATGMSTIGFGSDLAGSIRLPASFCGIYGFKPTFGVASMEGHIPSLPDTINGIRTLAVPGVLARNVKDLRLGFEIISAPNHYDRFVTPTLPDTAKKSTVKGMKVAWTDSFGGVPVSSDIKRNMQKYIDKLEKAGAIVTKVTPDGMDYNDIWELWGSFVGMQSNLDMSNFKRAIGDIFARSTTKSIPMQRNIVGPITVKKFLDALSKQSHYITIFDNFLDQYDVWICPVSSTTAFKHHAYSKTFGDFKIYNDPIDVDGEKVNYYIATQSYTTAITATNNPVVSMPIGMGDNELPINVQVVGKRYSDLDLLNKAEALSEVAQKIKYPLEN